MAPVLPDRAANGRSKVERILGRGSVTYDLASKNPGTGGAVVMSSTTFLLECLLRAGMRDVVTVEPATGGVAALAGVATRRDASSVFVKAFADAPADDVFVAGAEGLAALHDLGGMTTPEVILANRELPIVQLRQHLAVLAQFDDDWGAGDQIRATLAPFRTRT